MESPFCLPGNMPNRQLLLAVGQGLLGAIDEAMRESTEGAGLAWQGYRRGEPDRFSDGAARYADGAAYAQIACKLSIVLSHVIVAHHSHCLGERAFFSADYSAAEVSFGRSWKAIISALNELEGEVGDVLEELAERLRDYGRYYEIEAVEAAAFALRSAGRWPEAAAMHEREIALSSAAEAAHSMPDEFLAGFLAGHGWYARASRLRCLAAIAEEAGDEATARDHLVHADEAEANSRALNPQWRD